MGDRYNFSLTTFSPSGKLVQIEYALKAGIKNKKYINNSSKKKLNGDNKMLLSFKNFHK